MLSDSEPCSALVLRPVYTYRTKAGKCIDVKQGDGDVGGHVWDGAVILSRYLENHADVVKGRRVLELGAGPGLVGLVCALSLGASETTLTDGFPHIVRRLEETVKSIGAAHKQCNLAVQILDWRDSRAALGGRTFDVILGAVRSHTDGTIGALWVAPPGAYFPTRVRTELSLQDIIYKDELVEPFLDTVEAASHAGTRVYLANGDRVAVRHFMSAAAARGYTIEDIDFGPFLEPLDTQPAQRCRLWELTRRATA